MTNQHTNRKSRGQVSLRNITTKTEDFQFRHFETDPVHVKDLIAALTNGFTLDPLILWNCPETGKLVIVDGHHRLAAHTSKGLM